MPGHSLTSRFGVGTAALGVVVLGSAALGPGAGSGQNAAAAVLGPADSSAVTWSGDIAALVGSACASCHRPGGSAPFSLLEYEDVRSRAERIAAATADRRMPPWLPGGALGAFEGDRRLSADQIALFAQWVGEGTPAGDAAVVATVPADTWEPGPPDLVVELPPYQLAAEGRDVYRNFVVEIPVDESVWVESMELVPANARVVHHARIMVDSTSSSRALDAEDPAPGFDGMELRSNAANPDGQFVGWTPGKQRLPPVPGTAWRLDPGTDLVAQLHLRPTGSAETVDAHVELRFADAPPTRHPAIVVVSSLLIDIPAGEPRHTVSNSFTLPVDVEVLSVYPHAHYLGSILRATAVLPNGRERSLIEIPAWDFNWQDDYRLVEPIELPAGTTIVKEFSFDNSATNPHNPSNPPRRVVYGSNSDDEMADLILQVMPRNESERTELLVAQAWQHETEDMAYLAHQEFVAGSAALDANDLDEATRRFQETLAYRADHVGALSGLTDVFIQRGDAASATLIARQAVTMSRSQSAEAFEALAKANAAAGDDASAISAAEQGLRLARAGGDTTLITRLEARLRELRGG